VATRPKRPWRERHWYTDLPWHRRAAHVVYMQTMGKISLKDANASETCHLVTHWAEEKRP